MRRLGNIAEPQKVFERYPNIGWVSERFSGKRHRPFVAKALAIDVQVWDPDLLIIGIAMRRATEIESDEHYDLPPPILHFDFDQVDSTAAQIEQELPAFIAKRRA
jgi:hypothetical protein